MLTKLYTISSIGILICAVFISSCAIFKPSPKTAFVNGIYKQSTHDTTQKVYVEIDDDSLYIYTYGDNKELTNISRPDQVLPYEAHVPMEHKTSFTKSSYDVDFITIPLKYRFARKQVAPQLNANLNGAIYLGYRTDKYAVRYINNPLKKSLRNITHFGFSIGVYTGLGNTFMSPTNTDNQIDQEYDGLVWTKGVAGIIAINNFTVGLTLGFDNLLDKNRKVWIYESQPYLGFAVGLNLN
jgi:hypothetical protein